MDLGDMLTSRQVRDLLHSAESLAGKQVDLDAFTKVLTSVRGVTFAAEAGDRINGRMRVHFGESPAPLKQVAKALIFEVLEHQSMIVDDGMKDWRVVVEAKAVLFEGRLSTKGLRMLTNLSLGTSVMRKQETAVLKSNQMQIYTMLEEKTAEVRRKMSLKYKVEF